MGLGWGDLGRKRHETERKVELMEGDVEVAGRVKSNGGT